MGLIRAHITSFYFLKLNSISRNASHSLGLQPAIRASFFLFVGMLCCWMGLICAVFYSATQNDLRG